jgi:hypothetical protein
MSQTKEIPLSRGEVAVVDEEDYEKVINFGRWWCSDTGYAICHIGTKKVRMHRLINNTPKGLITDHINGNRLDNRKTNLRTVDHKENAANGVGFTRKVYKDLPKYVTYDYATESYFATYKTRKHFKNLDDAIKFTKEGK